MTLESILEYPLRYPISRTVSNEGTRVLLYDLRYKRTANTIEIPWGCKSTNITVPHYIEVPLVDNYHKILPKTAINWLYNTIGARNFHLEAYKENEASIPTVKSVYGLVTTMNNKPILEFTQVYDLTQSKIIKYVCRIGKSNIGAVNNKLQDYIKGTLLKNLIGIQINNIAFDIHIFDYSSPLITAAAPSSDDAAVQQSIQTILTTHRDEIIDHIII